MVYENVTVLMCMYVAIVKHGEGTIGFDACSQYTLHCH